MGARSDARQALVDWIEGGHIDGLDKIYPTYPRVWDWNAYGSGPFRCQLSVDFEADGELRMAVGGEHSGRKRIDYLVCLDVMFRSTSQDNDQAMAAFDDLIDDLKIRLRADRRFGTDEAIVWQGGEGGYGIQTEFERPDTHVGGEPTEYRARMRFEITQWIVS